MKFGYIRSMRNMTAKLGGEFTHVSELELYRQSRNGKGVR